MTMQKHGHLYYISLVPMGDVLEFVECQTCSKTWDPSVLAPTLEPAYTQEAFDDFYETLLNVMILMMLVDGTIEDAERGAISDLFEKIVGIELAQTDLDAEIGRAVNRGPDGLMFDIAAQRHTLDQEMRIMFLRAALLVAFSDGEFADAEQHGLARIAEALGVTDEQLRAMIEELSAAAAADSDGYSSAAIGA
jgi:uncharacterized tellurite resistance protein B-like protein